MSSFFRRVSNFSLRLILWLVAAVFALSLLFASLVLITLGLLKALLTGRKPQPMVFARFQQFPRRATWPGAAPGKAGATQAEIVDVEVREIRDDRQP